MFKRLHKTRICYTKYMLYPQSIMHLDDDDSYTCEEFAGLDVTVTLCDDLGGVTTFTKLEVPSRRVFDDFIGNSNIAADIVESDHPDKVYAITDDHMTTITINKKLKDAVLAFYTCKTSYMNEIVNHYVKNLGYKAIKLTDEMQMAMISENAN